MGAGVFDVFATSALASAAMAEGIYITTATWITNA
jgi:hypothetical protein